MDASISHASYNFKMNKAILTMKVLFLIILDGRCQLMVGIKKIIKNITISDLSIIFEVTVVECVLVFL
jgi:hypothetical protein